MRHLLWLPVLVLLVWQIPASVATASCSCAFEYDWLFDIGLSQTWVTLTVTIHMPMSIFGPLNFGSNNRFTRFTAYDSSNSPLQISVDDSSSGREVAVLLGGQQGEGYTFSLRFLDSGLTSIEGPSRFKALWTWSVNNGVVLNTFHLWLPQDYIVSSLTGSPKTYTTTVLQGRLYVTSQYLAALNEQYYWYLDAVQGTVTVTNSAILTTSTGGNSESSTINTIVSSTYNQTVPLYQGPYELQAVPSDYVCIADGLPFTALKNQRVLGKIASSNAISFYVMPDQLYQVWIHEPVCGGSVDSALIKEYGITSYTIDLDIPNDGKYWFVFANFLQTPIKIDLDLSVSGPATTVSTMVVYSPTSASSISSLTSTTSTPSGSSAGTAAVQSTGPQPTLTNMGLIGIPFIVAAVAAILVVARKRGRSHALVIPKEIEAGPTFAGGISTGYPDLDHLLAGGLPEGYSILILSASWDERDLLLRRITDSCVQSGRPTFYVTNDVRTTNELVQMYPKSFHAYSAFASKTPSSYKNLSQIPDVGNLSEFTISLATAIREASIPADVNKLLIIDVLSDILIRHKTPTTLRWASEFFAKRKVEKFTIIAALNPSIAPKESQPLLDIFDGVIEIYEKALGQRTRRFLTIRKMHGRKYSDEDLLLDRNKLFKNE